MRGRRGRALIVAIGCAPRPCRGRVGRRGRPRPRPGRRAAARHDRRLRRAGLRRRRPGARRSRCSWSSSRGRSGSCATGSSSTSRSSTSATGSATAAEQVLLSVAFDPGYAKNRRFYVYYTTRPATSRWTASGGSARARPGPRRARGPGRSGSSTRGLEPQRRQRSSGPTGCSTWGPATAATPAPRTATPRPQLAARQAAAHRPGAHGRLSDPEVDPFDVSRGRARSTRRPAQPVPVLVRQPLG